MLNFLGWAEAVCGMGGGYFLEHPADPEEEPLPSIFATALMIYFELRVQGRRIIQDQCMLGGPSRKRTCVSSNLDALEKGAVTCDRRHKHAPSHGLRQPGEFQRVWSDILARSAASLP